MTISFFVNNNFEIWTPFVIINGKTMHAKLNAAVFERFLHVLVYSKLTRF